MIRVYIYHKNPEILRFIYNTINDYFTGIQHTYRIFASWKYKEAALYLQKTADSGDIFFFDFSDFETAIKFSSYLRAKNSIASLVHIGNIDSLLKTLYLRPSAFLDDPLDKGKILEIITQLDTMHQKIQSNKFFSFKYEGEPMRIAYNNIDYFESNSKKVILHFNKNNQEYCFTAKLDDIERSLPSSFLRCHQSYIVNMNNVQRFDAKNRLFLLCSNEEVYISKRMFSQAKERYSNYIKLLNTRE